MAILRTPFPIATFFDHRFKRKNRHKQLMAWTNRHGRTFCTMNLLNGFRRNIVSSDPEVLSEVFGRAQFEHFPERKAFKERFVLILICFAGPNFVAPASSACLRGQRRALASVAKESRRPLPWRSGRARRSRGRRRFDRAWLVSETGDAHVNEK